MKERLKYLVSLALCVFLIYLLFVFDRLGTPAIAPVCGIIYCIYCMFVPKKKKDEDEDRKQDDKEKNEHQ